MDEDRTLNFCTECGANIHQNDEYCPACGYRLKKNDVNYTMDPRFRAETIKKLNIVIITGAIWAIFVILDTIYGLTNLESTLELLREDPFYFTESMIELMRSLVIGIYSILVVSSILAIISVALCCLKRFNRVAYWACILGSILSLLFIVPGIIGLLLSGRIKAARSEFKD